MEALYGFFFYFFLESVLKLDSHFFLFRGLMHVHMAISSFIVTAVKLQSRN